MFQAKFVRPLLALACLALSPLVQAQGKVRIVVSVDWEGEDLQSQNLLAMKNFRQDYPEIPLQHFLNAAYYTKAGARPSVVTAAIRSVLRPGDEHGLHIHSWKSLVEASGVSFRTGPSFVQGTVDLNDCVVDCGHDVVLNAYTNSELRRIIKFSVSTLQNNGFDRAKSFRAGGWQADANVLRALAAEGFTLDSSATYAPYLFESWSEPYQLYGNVAALWPTTVPTSQPYSTDLGAGLSIIELPNNGCLADYMTGSAILKAFVTNAKLQKTNPQSDVYLSIGFHQETASTYLPALRSGIDKIIAYAKAQNIAVEFVVSPF